MFLSESVVHFCLLLSIIPFYGLPQFVYPLWGEGHLACLEFGATINIFIAAINIFIQVFVSAKAFNHLSKHLGMGMLDRMVNFMTSCFPKWCYHFVSPPVRNEISWCPISLPIFRIVLFCLFCHSNQCVVVSHCGLNFHFPNDKYCQLCQIHIFSFAYL